MAGRKSKYTPERVKQITDALAAGSTHEDAFTVAGISHDTFYRWLNEKPDFSEAVTYAQSRAHLAAVYAIRYAIQGHPEESTTTETYTETRLRRGKDGEQIPYEHTRTVRKHTVAPVAPDWRAAVEYLKRRDPEHWSDRIKLDDWRVQAIADIKAGLVQYEPLAEAFDDSLAAELFRAAGIPIPARQSTPAD